jgi:hypothetical protein
MKRSWRYVTRENVMTDKTKTVIQNAIAANLAALRWAPFGGAGGAAGAAGVGGAAGAEG